MLTPSSDKTSRVTLWHGEYGKQQRDNFVIRLNTTDH